MHHASHLFGQKTTLPPSHVHIQRFSLPLPGRAGEKGQQFKEAIFPFSPMHHQFQTTPKKKTHLALWKKKWTPRGVLFSSWWPWPWPYPWWQLKLLKSMIFTSRLSSAIKVPMISPKMRMSFCWVQWKAIGTLAMNPLKLTKSHVVGEEIPTTVANRGVGPIHIVVAAVQLHIVPETLINWRNKRRQKKKSKR